MLTKSLFPLEKLSVYFAGGDGDTVTLTFDCTDPIFGSSVVGDEINLGGIVFKCESVVDEYGFVLFHNKYPLISSKEPRSVETAVMRGDCLYFLDNLLSLNAPFPLENVIQIAIPNKQDLGLFKTSGIDFDSSVYWLSDPGHTCAEEMTAKGSEVCSRLHSVNGVRPIITVSNFHSVIGRDIFAFGYKWICYDNGENFARFVCDTVIDKCFYDYIEDVTLLRKWLCGNKGNFRMSSIA